MEKMAIWHWVKWPAALLNITMITAQTEIGNFDVLLLLEIIRFVFFFLFFRSFEGKKYMPNAKTIRWKWFIWFFLSSEAIHQMGEHFHALDNEMNINRKKWSQSDEAIIQLNNRLCGVCQTNWEKLWIEIEMREDETMACLPCPFISP